MPHSAAERDGPFEGCRRGAALVGGGYIGKPSSRGELVHTDGGALFGSAAPNFVTEKEGSKLNR